MIKYIFCDLDGTLYNDSISERDIRAIEFAESLGIQFNIATGRVYTHAQNIIQNLNFNGYLICENGSYIYDRDNQCIFKGVLSDTQIKRIIEVYSSIDYIDFDKDVIYFKYDGEVIMPNDGSKSGYFKSGYKIDPEIMSKITYDSKVGNIGISSLDGDKLNMLVEDFKKKIGHECEVYISSEYTMNIVPKLISKFDAIKQVCKMNNIILDEVATIGDSPNDISMLGGVKMSFAMSKSVETVKASATYETPSVADAINMIMDYNSVLK